MKKYKFVSIKPFYGKVFLKNRLFKINNGHNIFFEFDRKLKKHAVVVYTHDLKKRIKADYYVYCDVPYPWNIIDWLKLITHVKKNILFCFESPLINPFNHLKFLHIFFRRVYTWNDDIVDNQKRFKFNIPQLDFRRLKSKSSRKNFLVLVNKKKSTPPFFKLISPFKKNLYKERLKILNYFEEKIPTDFSLYGSGWDKPNAFSIRERIFGFKIYNTYKGQIRGNNKLKVLSDFKYCISFENAEAPGYITEKIFDCFKVGCVPIYYGAPNIERYIPKQSFIDFREFKNYGNLLKYLQSMKKKEYKSFINSGKKFLQSKKTKEAWFEDGFLKLFLSAIT